MWGASMLLFFDGWEFFEKVNRKTSCILFLIFLHILSCVNFVTNFFHISFIKKRQIMYEVFHSCRADECVCRRFVVMGMPDLRVANDNIVWKLISQLSLLRTNILLISSQTSHPSRYPTQPHALTCLLSANNKHDQSFFLFMTKSLRRSFINFNF